MSVKRCNFLLGFNLRIGFFGSSYFQELSLWIAKKIAKKLRTPGKNEAKNTEGALTVSLGGGVPVEAFKT